jgi:hypothetical protein
VDQEDEGRDLLADQDDEGVTFSRIRTTKARPSRGSGRRRRDLLADQDDEGVTFSWIRTTKA